MRRGVTRLFGRPAVIGPVALERLLDVQHLDVPVPRGDRGAERRPHVRAVGPRTAAAVEHDRLIRRQLVRVPLSWPRDLRAWSPARRTENSGMCPLRYSGANPTWSSTGFGAMLSASCAASVSVLMVSESSRLRVGFAQPAASASSSKEATTTVVRSRRVGIAVTMRHAERSCSAVEPLLHDLRPAQDRPPPSRRGSRRTAPAAARSQAARRAA